MVNGKQRFYILKMAVFDLMTCTIARLRSATYVLISRGDSTGGW